MTRRVLVVGGGYIGVTALPRLHKKLPPKVEMAMANPHGYMMYQPLRPETAVRAAAQVADKRRGSPARSAPATVPVPGRGRGRLPRPVQGHVGAVQHDLDEGYQAWPVRSVYHGHRAAVQRRRVLVLLNWLHGPFFRDPVALLALKSAGTRLCMATDDQTACRVTNQPPFYTDVPFP